ncbi:hypothetical protein ACROYT_G037171 [Oculina patagonica]
MYSLGLFEKPPSRGFILIFTPCPKESNKKVLDDSLKMTIFGPSVEIPPRRLKLIVTPDPANRACLGLEMYSFGRFEKLPSRGFILIFTPCPKESNKKVLDDSLKMTIFGPSVEIPPRRLKLIFTPDQANRASLGLEMYSLGRFEKPPSRGFIPIFTPCPKESYNKVLDDSLKMTILEHCDEIPPGRLKLILTSDPANIASLGLDMYSLGLFEKPPSHGFILIFTPCPKESNNKVLDDSLKMTIFGPCVEIPPRRLKLIVTPDKANIASFELEIHSFGPVRKRSTRGFRLIFTPGSRESNNNVLDDSLKMTIFGPSVEIPPRRLKLIFTPDQAKLASFELEIHSLGVFEKPPSRGFIVIFTPCPKESNKKVLDDSLKMTIFGPTVEIPPRRLKLIVTKNPANRASLGLEMYSLGRFEKPPSRGFILIFTPCPKESNKKVLDDSLKMTIFGPSVEIPPRRLKLIFTPDPEILQVSDCKYQANRASLGLEMYSLGRLQKPPSRGFIPIFTPCPEESNNKVLDDSLKMTILEPCDEIPPGRLKLILTSDPANIASLGLDMNSLGLFENPPSHGFILISTPCPKESNNKVLGDSLKMTIFGPCVEIPPRRLKLIVTPDKANIASFGLEMYSLGLFEKPPSFGFILIFTPCPKESNKKVQDDSLKMTIFGPSVEIPPRRFKLILTPDQAKLASFELEIHSLGPVRKMSTRGFSLIFTPGSRESYNNVLDDSLKMTNFGPSVEIPPRRLKLILIPDQAKLASFELEIHSLGAVRKMSTRGFRLIFTPGSRESNNNVLDDSLKMTIFGPSVEIPPRRLKLIFTPDPEILQVSDWKCTVWVFLKSRHHVDSSLFSLHVQKNRIRNC